MLLELTGDKKLLIGGGYDWFIYDKHPEIDMFKVTGIQKGSSNKILAYLLRQKDGMPLLAKLPNEALDEKWEQIHFDVDPQRSLMSDPNYMPWVSAKQARDAMDAQLSNNIIKEESLK